MKNHGVWFILCLAILVLASACGPSAEELAAIGQNAMENQNWNQGADAFRKAVEQNPALAEAYRGLAYCQIQLGERDQAAESLQGLLRLRPDDCRAHLLLAQYAFEKKQWDDAVHHIACARQFAEYGGEIQESQRWLEQIRSAVKSSSGTVLDPVEKPTARQSQEPFSATQESRP
ncbi:MAG TPA: tetratricopeptide repeat protein [bacterium]|nr:tetratricopeptide repeat protein [bacterium]HQO33421.1 tetratricopeptide repeat protein [bacterium]HQP98830.1 tetratricopeptide repeat protein [bacterium]